MGQRVNQSRNQKSITPTPPHKHTLQAHVSSDRRLRRRAIAVDGVSVRHDQRPRPSLGAGPLGPNLPSIGARSAPPDPAPRVAVPPDPLTGPVLPRLTPRRLRAPLLSLQRCRFADARGLRRRCRHHPTPFRSTDRCRGARDCVGYEGEERGAKGEEGAPRVGWNRCGVEPEVREC